MTDTMKERIERAIYSATPRNKPFDMLPPIARRQYTKEAEAVLDAMREPDEAMEIAAYDADLDIYWSYNADGRPGGSGDVFRAMIDAAKAEDAT